MKGFYMSVISIFLLALASCEGLWSPTSTRELWRDAIRIGDILSSPSSYEGKDVTVVGYYRGWDLFGEAGCGPPLTRSDIAIADVTGGIYVVGVERIKGIEELSPFSLKDTDRLFKVKGVVRVSASKCPYIEAVEGGPVEGLPVGVVLGARRVGGIAAFDEELMIMDSGAARYLDRRARRISDMSVGREEISRALNILRVLPSGEIGSPVPDGFSYIFVFWDDGGIRTVKLHEIQLPRDAEELRGILNGWLSKARGG
jgi:hypothetical protein